MTTPIGTPSEQFRTFLTDTLKDTKLSREDKIEHLMSEFDEWITAHQSGVAVEVVGGRVAVQTVEAYGLEIGLDALGRATRIETVGLLNQPELTWSPNP